MAQHYFTLRGVSMGPDNNSAGPASVFDDADDFEFSFRKYASIENHTSEDLVEKAVLNGLTDGEWVASEKIHGANFSFVTNGLGVKCARRKGFLKPGDRFHNYEDLLAQYRSGVLQVYSEICPNVGDVELVADRTVVIIYGELYGGLYPHPEVPEDTSVGHVQRGVYYCPDIRFYAFDISTVPGGYVDWDVAEPVLQRAGFFVAPTLATGEFSELIGMNNSFPTTLPAIFGLPEIEDNICEGLVIKPLKNRYYFNGSRVVFKSKNDHFAEVTRAPKKNKVKKNKPLKLTECPPEVAELRDHAACFVNTNRLEAVLSKELESITETAKGRGQLGGLLAQDALKDFNKEFGERFDALDKPMQGIVKKHVAGLSARCVNDYIRQETMFGGPSGS